ncbi:MAG: methanogenesis marker protein Mmp4/MtxX [Methanomicrobiales archaeon]|nr:methanogenesis marker protein Mmp4/MtxX [Methanomicrobiales archaeon]
MIIGIGIAGDPAKILASIRKVEKAHRVIGYCREGIEVPAGITTRFYPSPETAMITDLLEGRLDAAVRGTLPSNETLQELRRQTGASHLERIALLETAWGKKFFLAPVGVDEGWTVQQKCALIRKGERIAAAFGLPGGTGVLSGGRLGDLGRHPAVDRSLAEAELVSRITGARHYEILIEDAIQDCSLLIAPDGISGNLIFRTLVFLGGGKGHGAPVVNIDRIFVDTSRASPDYADALILAASLANSPNNPFSR